MLVFQKARYFARYFATSLARSPPLGDNDRPDAVPKGGHGKGLCNLGGELEQLGVKVDRGKGSGGYYYRFELFEDFGDCEGAVEAC